MPHQQHGAHGQVWLQWVASQKLTPQDSVAYAGGSHLKLLLMQAQQLGPHSSSPCVTTLLVAPMAAKGAPPTLLSL
jgi:hypothetical protein